MSAGVPIGDNQDVGVSVKMRKSARVTPTTHDWHTSEQDEEHTITFKDRPTITMSRVHVDPFVRGVDVRNTMT
jgi:hypothetical protein